MNILLLDADGVLLKKKGYFSEHFAREKNVPIEDIVPFFKNEFRLCQEGKADLKEELMKGWLEKWRWDGTVEEFLEYWFQTDTEADEEVFTLVKQFQEKGVKCYLATDQEESRAKYIRETLDFGSRLDGCFFSCELGYSKSEPEFFKAVVVKLGRESEEITYFDDDQENVDVAKTVGIDAYFYNEINDLKALLE